MRTFRRPPRPSLAPVWRYVSALRTRFHQHAAVRTKAPPSPSPLSWRARKLSSLSPLEDAASLREFELLAPLGRGTFGVVRLARHVPTGRRVAIKALDLELVAERRQEESVEREREVHAGLSHPFVCSLLGSFEDARALFLVLEFCPGGELFGLLYDDEGEQDDEDEPRVSTKADDSDVDTDDVDGEPLTPTDAPGMDYETLARRHQQLYRRLYPGVSASLANALAKRALHVSTTLSSGLVGFDGLAPTGGILEWAAAFYLACVASALRYLHNAGVLYRDLKPENLLLDRDGYVKLIDFGQCKLASPSDKTQKAATMCGSREYMAPEVLQRLPSDGRADLWAFGVLMYELLVGHTPFYHDNPRELARRIIHEPVEFPHGFEAAHPLAAKLINSLLSKNPAQRPASFDEVVSDSPYFRAFFPTAESWERLQQKELPAPFVPSLDGDSDTRMFRRASTTSDAGVWDGEEDAEPAAAF